MTSLTTASEKLATSEMNAVRSFRVMAGPALPPFLVPVKGFGHSRPRHCLCRGGALGHDDGNVISRSDGSSAPLR
jgi:hypothetical protein